MANITGDSSNIFINNGDLRLTGSSSSIHAHEFKTISSNIVISQTVEGTNKIAIGYNAGIEAGEDSIAIGRDTAFDNQGISAIAIGFQAGHESQGNHTIALGSGAGADFQGSQSISIGRCAGEVSQGSNCIAIGSYAGNTNQHNGTIVLNASGSPLDTIAEDGFYVSPIRQTGETCVLLGVSSNSEVSQLAISADSNGLVYNNKIILSQSSPFGPNTISIGANVPVSQGNESIAIGLNSGYQSQNNNSIAIGPYAGYQSQGNGSIAIGVGAGKINQHDNTIVLSANSTSFSSYLNTKQSHSLYIDTVRSIPSGSSSLLCYDSGNCEIYYMNTYNHNAVFQTVTSQGDIHTSGNLYASNIYVTNHVYEVEVQNLTVGNAIVGIGFDNVVGSDSGIVIYGEEANIASIVKNGTYYMGYTNNAINTSDPITFQGSLPVTIYGNLTSNYITSNGVNITSTCDALPGIYGSGNVIPQVTVSSNGRVTSVSNVAMMIPTLDQVINSGNTTSNILHFNSGFTTGTGFVGINTSTNGAQLKVVNSSASQPVLSVIGASGQTANLQTWNSNNGNVVARVNSTGSLYLSGYMSRGVPVVYSNGATIGNGDGGTWVITNNNGSSSDFVITLPSPSAYLGREIYIRKSATPAAGALYRVVSSASNIITLENYTTTSNVIISAGQHANNKVDYGDSIYRWATLVSNGTNWIVMAGA